MTGDSTPRNIIKGDIIMKRIIALALAVLMAAAMFAACGGSSGPEGKYVVKSINGETPQDQLQKMVDEKTVESASSVEDLLKVFGVDSVEEIVTMELKSDGTAVMEAKMFSLSAEGTWEKDGDKINITIDGSTATFTLNGNELSNDQGDPKYVLVKK